MTDSNPAITALALIELLNRHIADAGDNNGRTVELRALLADDDDGDIHADFMVEVALELATFAIGFAVQSDRSVDVFVADYRARLLARGDGD